jgi:hypothetical protein
MVKPNIDEMKDTTTRLLGIKVTCECSVCRKKWALWFKDLDTLINTCPPDFYICSNCDADTYFGNSQYKNSKKGLEVNEHNTNQTQYQEK